VSVPVALEALRERIQAVGPDVFLLTVSDGPVPHAVSADVRWDGEQLVVGAGRTTARNVAASPAVTLLWPASGQDYSLIVDGSGAVDGDVVRITPERAILHRSVRASAPDGHTTGDAPRCITVL